MDLFTNRAVRDRLGQPLAERMRPRNLDEFVGQRHLLGQDKMFDRMLASGQLLSLIVWGPPGSGKTTVARIIATQSKAEFVALSAVSTGLKEVREIVAQAAERLAVYRQRTILFLDEIHRFNKAQQDALLPHVESGTVVLIGATTENPSFEVNAALLSRCKVVRLERLGDDDIGALLQRALSDRERGIKNPPEVEPGALQAIAHHADGDARRALTTLELASALGRRIDTQSVEAALQQKTLLHDRAGDAHYNLVSAFIKSMRGSDPNASVYWMARMLEAGEDPVFVCRRMVIFAGEDIGLADPHALSVAVSATQATQLVGQPECVLPMTMAALYLARAPKSNSALTSWATAQAAVEKHGCLAVPMQLRNAPTPLLKAMGCGAGYQYPHNFEGHHVAQARYLPDELADQHFYNSSRQGEET